MKKILILIGALGSTFAIGACGISSGPSLLSRSSTQPAQRGALEIFSWIGAITSNTSLPGWATTGQNPNAQYSNPNIDGAYDNLNGLAIDYVNGLMYAVDSSHNKISKINLHTGAVIGSIGKTSATTGTCPVGVTTAGWCTGGVFTNDAIDGAFDFPNDIAIDASTNSMYIVDATNNRISKYILSSGVYFGSVGETSATSGTCPASGVASSWCTGGTFVSDTIDGSYTPTPITYNPLDQTLYVGDVAGKITKLNAVTGQFIGSIGKTSASSGTCPVGIATTWCTGGTFVGSSAAYTDGGYSYPIGLSIDPANNFLYSADANENKVSRISLTGAFSGSIGNVQSSSGSCPASGSTTAWCMGGVFRTNPTPGAGLTGFSLPYGLAADPAYDLMYVGDANGNRLMQFKLSTGEYIGAKGKVTAIGGTCTTTGPQSTWCKGGTFGNGSAIGDFDYPQNAYATPDGYIYVLDNTNGRIVRLTYR